MNPERVTPVLPMVHGVPALLTDKDQLPAAVYVPDKANVYVLDPEPTVAVAPERGALALLPGERRSLDRENPDANGQLPAASGVVHDMAITTEFDWPWLR